MKTSSNNTSDHQNNELKAPAIKGSEIKTGKEKSLDNNKPGATSVSQNNQAIPTVTPENDNGMPGPKSK